MKLSSKALSTFLKMQDALNTACFVTNQHLNITAVNSCAYRILGMKENHSIINLPLPTLFSNAGLGRIIDDAGALLSPEASINDTIFGIWNKIDIVLETTHYLYSCHITPNHLANIDYLCSIIENLPQLVYWKDKNGFYLGGNKHAAEGLNLKSTSEMIGKSDYDIGWSKERVAALRKIDNQVITEGINHVTEDVIPINNKNVYFLTSKKPMYNKQGDIIGILGISTDITEQKEMEKELRQAKEDAEAANRAKTAFIANMSHDLRTPLAGIVGEANLLKDELNDEEQKEHALHLAKSGSKLLSMYNEIIEDVTSSNMSEHNVESATFDLVSLATDLQDLEMPTLVTKGLQFNASIDAGIPTFLVSDRRKIERIIENLLGNAIKFTKKGHIDLKIELLEKQENVVKLKFNIIDTGIGVPEESKSKLFERFYKVSPSYKGEYQGFGLGLDIAKNYTHLLGGTIGFESTEGVGSDFYIILSLKIASQDEINLYKKNLANKPSSLKLCKGQKLSTSTQESLPKESIMPTTPTDFTDDSDTPHILVLEDNVIAQRILIALLKNMKLTSVTAAADGEAALELAKTQHFDLILSDVGLPGMSGMDFTRAFRQFEKEQKKMPTPIIAVTAHATDDRDECLNAGMDGAVTKPVTPDILSEIFATFLPDFKISKQN